MVRTCGVKDVVMRTWKMEVAGHRKIGRQKLFALFNESAISRGCLVVGPILGSGM